MAKRRKLAPVPSRHHFTIREGNTTVKVTDGFAAMVERVLREANETVIAPMEAQARKQIDIATGKWPDKGRKKSAKATGRSRRAFRMVTVYIPSKHVVRVQITNDATNKGFFYAGAIQSRIAGTTGSGELKKPWIEFVRKPMQKRVRSIRDHMSRTQREIMLGRR